MSIYTMEIDDEAITEKVNLIINQVLNRELAYNYSPTGHAIAEMTKEVVYAHKDEIIEKVVERATKEIVRKGLPKLLERVAE